MEKIPSFKVNHLTLLPGLYVSRKDNVNGTIVTTFDIRMTRPNYEPVMNTAEMHTIEHLGATFLRNHETYKDRVIYFGPMGCRTGFYLVLVGDYASADIVPLMTEMYTWMSEFEGDIPGACARDCGNYLDQNLNMAKYLSKKYLTQVLKNIGPERLVYPE
ncbi:MAG: S-ribosylhomocysteine lyase [Lachnospiraceae bacterium]|nr:S-ribosylhomocysteine lyase [Lachnospiraceae bacterium]